MPPRIVLDTNCLITAFLFPGSSREIFNLARKKKVYLITSRILLSELSETIHKKFQGNQLRTGHFLNKLHAVVTILDPKSTIIIIVRDPDDNRVLEAAVEGDCEYIVTGDKDLLELKSFKGIKIVTPKKFLELFTAQ